MSMKTNKLKSKFTKKLTNGFKCQIEFLKKLNTNNTKTYSYKVSIIIFQKQI